MRVLLIGGAGYIGSHCALAFLDRGYQVGILDNFSTGSMDNIPSGCEVYTGDINNPDQLDPVCALNWDAVVHMAALKAAGVSMTKPELFAQNNITGSLNIIRGCITHGIDRFILSSSAAVYGEPEYLPIDEEHPTRPENYYGYTKLSIEGHLAWFDRLKGLTYSSLRYFNAAGYDPSGRMRGLEQDPANLIPVVMETAVGMRRELQVFGTDYDTPDGTGVRDYVHVTDLAEAHVLALEYLLEHGTSLTVNLGSQSGLSVLEILEKSREISGRAIPATMADRRPGDPAKLVASSAKAKELLGWEPQYSDLETIISSTWNIYKDKTEKL
mgnify:CR=1 FL=1